MSTADDPVLRIGSVVLTGRAFLAPMSGITDIGMRRIAQRFGAALVVSEMVASDDFVKGAEESRIRAEGRGVDPHVVQIAGCEPRWMGEAARLAEASGAAVVDINMGCPAKRVTGGYAGSALMLDIDHATRLIEATVASVTIPVTLKMRLGWDTGSIIAPELARRAEAAGIRLITVHGRTRCQFYKGRADWRAIAAVKQVVAIPVVANGDCTSLNAAAAMRVASGADAVMIGRAALGRPWFVGDLAHYLAAGSCRPAPNAAARRDAVVEHYETLLGLFGVARGLRHARKHLAAYADHALRQRGSLTTAGRARLVTSDNPSEVKQLIGQMFSSIDTSQFGLAA